MFMFMDTYVDTYVTICLTYVRSCPPDMPFYCWQLSFSAHLSWEFSCGWSDEPSSACLMCHSASVFQRERIYSLCFISAPTYQESNNHLPGVLAFIQVCNIPLSNVKAMCSFCIEISAQGRSQMCHHGTRFHGLKLLQEALTMPPRLMLQGDMNIVMFMAWREDSESSLFWWKDLCPWSLLRAWSLGHDSLHDCNTYVS